MKIKFNWGTGIALAILFFIAFIMYFVIKVQSDNSYNNELVVEDYYKKERTLEDKLSREQNAANLTEQVTIHQNAESIIIHFPQAFDATKITGKVSLYRPSNQRLDFDIPISISAPQLLIPKSDLAGGRWDIAVEWKYNDTEYRNNKMLTVN